MEYPLAKKVKQPWLIRALLATFGCGGTVTLVQTLAQAATRSCDAGSLSGCAGYLLASLIAIMTGFLFVLGGTLPNTNEWLAKMTGNDSTTTGGALITLALLLTVLAIAMTSAIKTVCPNHWLASPRGSHLTWLDFAYQRMRDPGWTFSCSSDLVGTVNVVIASVVLWCLFLRWLLNRKWEAYPPEVESYVFGSYL